MTKDFLKDRAQFCLRTNWQFFVQSVESLLTKFLSSKRQIRKRWFTTSTCQHTFVTFGHWENWRAQLRPLFSAELNHALNIYRSGWNSLALMNLVQNISIYEPCFYGPVNGGQPSILLKETVSMLQRTSGAVPSLRRFSSIIAPVVRS